MSETAYHVNIGDYKCFIFSDGYLEDPDGNFGLNCIYIESGKYKILIDNGCGQSFQGTAGQLVKNMAAEGIKPEDITTIIFDHAHIDHVCGTFDLQGKPVYPNARYIIAKKEWDFIEAGPGNNELHNNLFAHARGFLPALKDRFKFVHDKYQVLPGIKMIYAPGHTPGNSMVEISSKGKKLLCVGDIIHSTDEFTKPEKYIALDISPELAVKTRAELLAKSAKDGAYIFATHLAFPGLGYIKEKQGILGWEPIK